MTDFKLDTEALISKAHETEAVRNPTDGIIYDVRAYLNSLDSLATVAGDYALQYAHRLKDIDVEGMFNMYEMESDYGHMKLDIIIERFIRNGFYKENAIIAYVLIDMLMNEINEHIHEWNDLTGEDTVHDDINYHDIAAGLNALIEHMPLEYAVQCAIIAYDAHDGQ